MWEDGKRFPDEERPKLPWDDEPEESRKKRKKSSWERFRDAEENRGKIIIFCAVMGVAAAAALELVCSGHIPEILLKRSGAHVSRPRGRFGFFLQFFNLFEVAGGLVGAGIGWVIARLMSAY